MNDELEFSSSVAVWISRWLQEEERVEECACMDLLREMFENPIVVAAVADASPKDFERAKSLLGHHDWVIIFIWCSWRLRRSRVSLFGSHLPYTHNCITCFVGWRWFHESFPLYLSLILWDCNTVSDMTWPWNHLAIQFNLYADYWRVFCVWCASVVLSVVLICGWC